jgi:hypothetical protein
MSIDERLHMAAQHGVSVLSFWVQGVSPKHRTKGPPLHVVEAAADRLVRAGLARRTGGMLHAVGG